MRYMILIPVEYDVYDLKLCSNGFAIIRWLALQPISAFDTFEIFV